MIDPVGATLAVLVFEGVRLALAQGCLETGQVKLARSLYAALDREMTERNLVEWEPALAGACLEGLVRAIRAGAHSGEVEVVGDDAVVCLRGIEVLDQVVPHVPLPDDRAARRAGRLDLDDVVVSPRGDLQHALIPDLGEGPRVGKDERAVAPFDDVDYLIQQLDAQVSRPRHALQVVGHHRGDHHLFPDAGGPDHFILPFPVIAPQQCFHGIVHVADRGGDAPLQQDRLAAAPGQRADLGGEREDYEY